MDADELTMIVLRDPTPRVPVPALDRTSIRGQRIVVLLADDKHHWGYIAWSDVYTDSAGAQMIDYTGWEDWDEYRYFKMQPDPDRVQAIDARAVWLE